MRKESLKHQQGFGKAEIAANTSLFNFVWDNLRGNSKQIPLEEESKSYQLVFYKESERRVNEGNN